MRWNRLISVISAVTLGWAQANSATVLHVNDENGMLGTINADTGEVNFIGSLGVMLTDIAFDPFGNLYGISFNSLYSIDKDTATTTYIGEHGVYGGNALVFGNDGTLYAAGYSSGGLYTIDTSSGMGTNIGNVGVGSGGDLAFIGSDLYMSDLYSRLIRTDLTDTIPSNSTVAGVFDFNNVYGIATSGSGQAYGVADTTMFEFDPYTGATIRYIDVAGRGLGTIYGQSFFAEAGAMDEVPLPSALALMGMSLMTLFGVRRRSAAAVIHQSR